MERDLHIIRQLYSKRRTARVLFFRIGYYEKCDTDMFFYRYPSFSSIDDKQGRTGNHFIKKSNIKEKKYGVVTLWFNNMGQFENGSEENPTTIENFLRRNIEDSRLPFSILLSEFRNKVRRL